MNPFRKLFGTPTARQQAPARAARPAGLRFEGLEDRAVPAIVGAVFHDRDFNGVRDAVSAVAPLGSPESPVIQRLPDAGVAGVTVSAYNSAGALVGSATTDANGNYAIQGTAAGQQYRVLFTGLAAGTYVGPYAGGSSGTAVQFVDGAGAANLGLADASQPLAALPSLVTTCYVFGAANDPAIANDPAVIAFRYNSGAAKGDPTLADYSAGGKTVLATIGQVGATWGVAHNQRSNEVYSAAFFKKHSGFGAGGPGAIYRSDVAQAEAGTPNASVLVDLNALFPASKPGGVSAHTNAAGFDAWLRDNDNAAFDAVGKTGLGGLAISEDGNTLYTIGLADRKLYAIPLNGPINAATVKSYAIPLPASVTGRTGANPNGDLRPFAVTFHEGNLYVGAVNSAESTAPDHDLGRIDRSAARDAYGMRPDMKAYVFKFDPTAGRFEDAAGAATTTQPVFEMDLNYSRVNGSNGHGAWLPWQKVYQSRHDDDNFERLNLPQAMLTSLAFDANDNIVLGFRDRAGDQFGTFTQDNPADDKLRDVAASGDMLMAFRSGAGWTLEHNGRNLANPTDPNGSQGPQGTSNGPGGGEWFYDDNYGNEHGETTSGAVLIAPGLNQVVNTVYNPITQFGVSPDTWFSSGIKLTDLRKGNTVVEHQIFQATTERQVGKANGLGGLTFLSAPPVEVGNRVWLDSDNDGVQDAGEAPIAGVVVTLCDAQGNVLATATTDAQGQYYFSSAPGASTASRAYGVAGLKPDAAGYMVKLDAPSNYAPGGPLAGRSPTATKVGANPEVDSDGALVSGVVKATFATGPRGSANHSIDFGFVANPGVAPNAGINPTFETASQLASKQGFLASAPAAIAANQAETNGVRTAAANPDVAAHAAWLELLYRDVLGRAADSQGFSGYLARLQGGATRQSIVREVLNSAEYRNYVANATIAAPRLDVFRALGNGAEANAFVDGFYRQFLRRAGDQGSVSAYASRAAGAGNALDVAAELLASDEYVGLGVLFGALANAAPRSGIAAS